MIQILIHDILLQMDSILYQKSWLDESFRDKLLTINEQQAFLQVAEEAALLSLAYAQEAKSLAGY